MNVRISVLCFSVLTCLVACTEQLSEQPTIGSTNALSATPAALLKLTGTPIPNLPAPTPAPTAASADQLITGHITASDGQAFEYQLPIPQAWANKYAIQEHGYWVAVEYRGKPSQPETIFTFAAHTEDEWQAAQKSPHGVELFSSHGIIFALDIAKANPFTDSQDKDYADEFQQWARQINLIVSHLNVKPVP